MRVARQAILPMLIMLAASLGALAPGPQEALAASARAALPGTSAAPGMAPAGAVSLGAVSVSAGGYHSCAIEGGAAYCWGSNENGELGDGVTGRRSGIPKAVDTSGALAGKTLTQIATGDVDTCALDAAGAAYCWGNNQDGQLGDGSTTPSNVPVAVDASGVLAGKTLTRITLGDEYMCALDAAGAAYCWGGNVVGQLGAGSSADHSSVPVAVDTSGALAGKTLTQITAADYGHTCALAAGGTAYCWGDNNFGELGNNSPADSSVPVAVDTSGALAGKTLTQVTAAGEYHTCALAAGGTAYCWGYGADGQLGNGGTADSSVPVAVDTTGALAGKTLTHIADGAGYYTCALAAGGTAYCWGDNGYGAGGSGTAASSSVPVAVDTTGALAGKTLTQITDGYDHTCAADAVGAVYCWGDNHGGDLGVRGLHAQSDVPVLTGPQAPGGVTAVPRAASAIVSWTAPASLDGGHLNGYTAVAAPGGASCATRKRTCTITGLTGGTTYTVTVVARTSAGNSGASAAVRFTPGAPGPIISGSDAAKCVDDSGDATANGTKIVISDCNGSAEQNWAVQSDGTIRIHAACLGVHGGGQASKTVVELWSCTQGASQRWQPRSGTLVNPVSGKCLTDPRSDVTNGTQLEIYTCNGGRDQNWDLP